MRSCAPRILIICYGNPLRGDDGAGQEVARQLEGTIDPDRAQVLYRHQLVPELAEPLSQSDVAFFVDAQEANEPPGSIAFIKLEPGMKTPDSMTHEFEPPTLLAYARHLYSAAPKHCELATIAGQTFEYGMELSPAVRERIPSLVRALKEKIEEYREEFSHA